MSIELLAKVLGLGRGRKKGSERFKSFGKNVNEARMLS